MIMSVRLIYKETCEFSVTIGLQKGLGLGPYYEWVNWLYSIGDILKYVVHRWNNTDGWIERWDEYEI